MILLSYILPCYNTELYIDKCINSLYEQGFDESEFEVICVNNASQDNLDENIIKAKKIHENIVHIKLSNNVYSGGAYNEGIKASKGKYIIFVDSDDYIKENSIKSLIDDMEANHLEALQINIQPFGFPNSNSSIDINSLAGNGNMSSAEKPISGVEYMSLFKSLNEISLMPIPAYRRIFLRDFIVSNNLYFSLTTIGCDLLHSLQVFSVLRWLKITANKVYMFRYNPNGVTKGNWSIDKNHSLITNMLKSYDVVSNMDLEESVKQIFLQHIGNLLNRGLTKINGLHLNDKRTLLGLLDFKDIKQKTQNFKFVCKFPSFYLFLYKNLGNKCSNFIIKLCDLCSK